MIRLRYDHVEITEDVDKIKAKMYFFGAKDVAVADWNIPFRVHGYFINQESADKASENIDEFLFLNKRLTISDCKEEVLCQKIMQ